MCLADRAGQPVSKDEILSSVWANTFVGDDVLKRSISELRRVFGDDVQSPSIIQTIPKRGYRLVAPVEPVVVPLARAAAHHRQSTKPVFRNKTVLAIAIASLALILVGAAFLLRKKQSSETQVGLIRIRSLAVLPLENLSTDPEQAYFSDGMTDGLITDLAQIGSLKVISRTSSMQYKQTKKSLPEIARQLNVDGVVEGTTQRSGSHLRITVQLIEAFTDHHLWANTYEGELGDTFQLEKHVAEDVANQVLARVAARNQLSTSTSSRVVDVRALDEYLQGTYDLNRFSRGSGDEELKLAADHFQRATEIDQNFALAYLGLASAHSLIFHSSNDDVQIAIKAVERALQLDPTLSDAWNALGDIQYNEWNWGQAEADFRRAIALNPNNAQAHDGLGDLLDILGKFDEGLKEYEFAEELDPDQDHLVYAFYKRHDYDRAVGAVLRGLVKDPNDGYRHHQLFENYLAKGMYEQAIEQLQEVMKLFGFPDIAVRLGNRYRASGYIGAMREYAKALDRMHTTGQVFAPINIAAAYAAINDKERAFYWLEEGYKQRGRSTPGVPLSEVGVYSGLEPLHSDPRFTKLLQRMGLATSPITASARAQATSEKTMGNP